MINSSLVGACTGEIGWILRDRAFSRNSPPSAAHDVDGSLAAGFRRHLVSLRAATRTRRLYVGVSRGRIGGLLVKRDSGLLVGCDNRRIIIAVIAILSGRPPTSLTPVFCASAYVAYPYPAQRPSIHRAAEMAFPHPPKMPPAHPAAEVASTTATTATAACKRVGGNASASHRYGGNHDRDSVQLNLHSLVRGLR